MAHVYVCAGRRLMAMTRAWVCRPLYSAGKHESFIFQQSIQGHICLKDGCTSGGLTMHGVVGKWTYMDRHLEARRYTNQIVSIRTHSQLDPDMHVRQFQFQFSVSVRRAARLREGRPAVSFGEHRFFRRATAAYMPCGIGRMGSHPRQSPPF